MGKLVLVPYVKYMYQGMLEMTHHPKTPGDNSTSTEVTEPNMDISPTPSRKKTKRKVVDSDEITVIAPPPEKREVSPGRRADMAFGKIDTFRDWISF